MYFYGTQLVLIVTIALVGPVAQAIDLDIQPMYGSNLGPIPTDYVQFIFTCNMALQRSGPPRFGVNPHIPSRETPESRADKWKGTPNFADLFHNWDGYFAKKKIEAELAAKAKIKAEKEARVRTLEHMLSSKFQKSWSLSADQINSLQQQLREANEDLATTR